MRKLIAATTLATSLVLLPAIDTVHAQEDAAAAEDDDDNGDMGMWGLAGLLGLIGLAGLKRRNDPYDRDRTTGTSATR